MRSRDDRWTQAEYVCDWCVVAGGGGGTGAVFHVPTQDADSCHVTADSEGGSHVQAGPDQH